MKTGIDNGYNAVKAVTEARRASFPSVVGTPTRARFSINEQDHEIEISHNGQSWLVGELAVDQSRFVLRREDRSWISSDEYRLLFLAALSELSTATYLDVQAVTGLPLAYMDDREAVIEALAGEHTIQRAGRTVQRFRVSVVKPVPQPFGTLCSEALDNRGQLVDQTLAGRGGIIDVGGKTTNILSVKKLGEIATESTSINMGGWDIVRQLRDHLAGAVPGLELSDHELAEAVRNRCVSVAGEPHDLGPVVDDITSTMATMIANSATERWGSALHLDFILIAGGGAHLIGEAVRRQFKQARIVSNPVYANAIGFWKLAQRVS